MVGAHAQAYTCSVLLDQLYSGQSARWSFTMVICQDLSMSSDRGDEVALTQTDGRDFQDRSRTMMIYREFIASARRRFTNAADLQIKLSKKYRDGLFPALSSCSFMNT